MAESKSRSSSKSGSGSKSKSKSQSGSKSQSSSSRSKSSGSKSQSSASKSKSSGSGSSSRSSSNSKKPREVVLEAAQQLQELIGRPIESVLGMEKDGSEWSVAVEVLELERVPSTTDVLARYEVTLDSKGELSSVRRTRRYFRAEAGEV